MSTAGQWGMGTRSLTTKQLRTEYSTIWYVAKCKIPLLLNEWLAIKRRERETERTGSKCPRRRLHREVKFKGGREKEERLSSAGNSVSQEAQQETALRGGPGRPRKEGPGSVRGGLQDGHRGLRKAKLLLQLGKVKEGSRPLIGN